MSARLCAICRRRKLVTIGRAPEVLQVCPVCDGEVYEIVVDREQRERPA